MANVFGSSPIKLPSAGGLEIDGDVRTYKVSEGEDIAVGEFTEFSGSAVKITDGVQQSNMSAWGTATKTLSSGHVATTFHYSGAIQLAIYSVKENEYDRLFTYDISGPNAQQYITPCIVEWPENPDQILILWGGPSYTIHGRIFQIDTYDGRAIAKGPTMILDPTVNSAYNLQAVPLAWPNLLILHSLENTNRYLYGLVLGFWLNGSNNFDFTIGIGNKQLVSALQSGICRAVALDQEKIFIAYTNNTYGYTFLYLKVGATSFSTYNQYYGKTVLSTNLPSLMRLDSDKVLCVSVSDGGKIITSIMEIASTSMNEIRFGRQTILNLPEMGANLWYNLQMSGRGAIVRLNDTQILICFTCGEYYTPVFVIIDVDRARTRFVHSGLIDTRHTGAGGSSIGTLCNDGTVMFFNGFSDWEGGSITYMSRISIKTGLRKMTDMNNFIGVAKSVISPDGTIDVYVPKK